MVNSILQSAGFELGKTYKETRFISPPKETYVVYNEAIENRGPDNLNMITTHDVSFEMYQYKPDPQAEARIERELNVRGISFQKQPRYWISSEQLYQIIYEFLYTEKQGG